MLLSSLTCAHKCGVPSTEKVLYAFGSLMFHICIHLAPLTSTRPVWAMYNKSNQKAGYSYNLLLIPNCPGA